MVLAHHLKIVLVIQAFLMLHELLLQFAFGGVRDALAICTVCPSVTALMEGSGKTT